MLLIILVVQSTDGVITYRLVSSHSCYRRYYSLFSATTRNPRFMFRATSFDLQYVAQVVFYI
jgi:hypothetical protein